MSDDNNTDFDVQVTEDVTPIGDVVAAALETVDEDIECISGLSVHFFKDFMDYNPPKESKSYTWTELCDLLHQAHKKERRIPSIGGFTLKKTGKVYTKRAPENVKSLSILILDYDKSSKTTEEIFGAWADVACFAHPTKSYGKGGKYSVRVYIPLSRTIKRDEHLRLVEFAKERSAAMGIDGYDNHVKDSHRVYAPPGLHRNIVDVKVTVEEVSSTKSVEMQTVDINVTCTGDALSIVGDGIPTLQVVDVTSTHIEDTIEFVGDEVSLPCYFNYESQRLRPLDVDVVLGKNKKLLEAGESLSDDVNLNHIEADLEIDGGPKGGKTTVGEFYRISPIGTTMKIHCPDKPDSTLGSAFASRVKSGVRICCTSTSHMHPTNKIWHYSTITEGSMDTQSRTVVNAMALTPKGAFQPWVSNIETILKLDARYANKLRLNDMNEVAEIFYYDDKTRKTEWVQYRNEMTTQYRIAWERIYGISFKDQDINNTIDFVAERNKYNYLDDHIKALPTWDQTPRLDNWLVTATGCEDTVLNKAYSRKCLIGMIERAQNPGCKYDQVLVLIGKQNAGKSLLFRILAGNDDLFTDEKIDVDNTKETGPIIHSRWIVEFSEIDKLSKKESADVKAFVSKQEDVFRKPYGRRTITKKRRCIFVGTTNKEEFLTDPTGSRRFLCVKVSDVLNLDWLRENRDQLMAEAYEAWKTAQDLPANVRYNAWTITGDEHELRAEVNDCYQTQDPFYEDMLDYAVAHRGEKVRIPDILKHIYGEKYNPQTLSPRDEQRVGKFLSSIQAKKVKGPEDRFTGKRPWQNVIPGDLVDPRKAIDDEVNLMIG